MLVAGQAVDVVKHRLMAIPLRAIRRSRRRRIDIWDPVVNTEFMVSRQTRALVRLREMILRGELAPGDRLAEAPVAEMLGVSRTPVRQALPVLAQEGLLSEHPTRGYLVRGFSTADISDAIDVRGALEGLAARRVAERGASRRLIDALRLCLAEGDRILVKRRVRVSDEALYVDMNTQFHRLIVREARSPMIEQSLDRIARIPFAGPQALAFDRTNLDRMYEMLSYAHRQHHFIVSALEHGESSRVEALMRDHANPVKESLNVVGGRDSRHRGHARPALARDGAQEAADGTSHLNGTALTRSLNL